jgi:hypothetical protein
MRSRLLAVKRKLTVRALAGASTTDQAHRFPFASSRDNGRSSDSALKPQSWAIQTNSDRRRNNCSFAECRDCGCPWTGC